jgi:protein bicaudal C
LQGNIPVALIFDYPEINIDCEAINKLMAVHDVYITSRQKSRQSTMCIVIKEVEKFITNIYDARHQLLKLTSERIMAAIPSSYYGPNDMAQFKNSSIAQLLAGPVIYGPISPIQQIPQITWSNANGQESWRSRPPTSPLTSSVLQQHNQMNNGMKIPESSSNMTMNRGSINELHSSGYHSFTTDSSMMKNASSGAGGSSNHSSPESYDSKYIQGMGNFLNVSQHQHSRRNSLNESMMYNLDPRVIAGLRAMNLTPQHGELRTPTPVCKI